MTMRPRLRKLALIGHVSSSVGWLGAAACVLALGVVGLTADDLQIVRSVYVAMELIGRFVLVPLAFASLLTGLLQALGTTWGLFRHYWVVFKLGMNLGAVMVLLLYVQTLTALADRAAQTPLSSSDLAVLRSPTVVLHSVLAMLLLVTAMTLAIYKPRGMTAYGRRKHEQRSVTTTRSERSRLPLD